jgi:tRNA (guanine37-N1)-methyltransferase
MLFDIVTLFPDMFPGYINESIIGRAQQAGHLTIRMHNLRDHAAGKHRVTDEPPYGGGGGMVLKPEPIFAAVEAILGTPAPDIGGAGNEPAHVSQVGTTGHCPVILLTPQGEPLTQSLAIKLAKESRMILICGRYEGVDERVRAHLVSHEISIGDYVLTGGELGAMVLVDAVSRLLPGVLGAQDAAESDSHAMGLLEGPHYTRPELFRGWRVPEVLRSGHDANIQRWRRQQALRRTWRRRPELLLTASLSEEDKRFLAVLAGESESLS